MILSIVHANNLYIADFLTNEGGLEEVPFVLKLCEAFTLIGQIMLIISQFTGLYYTFDSSNRYVIRRPGRAHEHKDKHKQRLKYELPCIFCRKRASPDVSLDIIAVDVFQCFKLFFIFHAFGYDLEIQHMSKRDDRFDIFL